MKLVVYTIAVLLLCFSCGKKKINTSKKSQEVSTTKKIIPAFQSLIDSAEVIGAIVIYDLQKDAYFSNDFEWANTGKLPASTFKIPNSIIGLETGIIESDSTVFKWDGERKWQQRWEQDLVLRDAFQFSCVPCYQELAREIGVKKMNAYVQKYHYGNLQIDSTNIDNFWLEGTSKISQMQQLNFLKRFYKEALPISKRTTRIVKNIMRITATDQYKLSGKSGLSNDNGDYNGWFVGFVEMEDNTYLFATNLEPQKEFDMDSFITKRLNLTLDAFKVLAILN